MSLRESVKLEIMNRIKRKEISLIKASEEVGLCYRQTLRLWSNYQENGPQGLISKRRGAVSPNRMSLEKEGHCIELVKAQYSDYGPTLAAERLEAKHGLKVSRETLRKLMMKEGFWKPKKVNRQKVYARRTRRSRFGELVQIDGSYHDWFEGRSERCCLLVGVDDATSCLTHLQFCRTETTLDYLKFINEHLKKHGRPLAFYSDKHSIFRVNNKKKEGPCSTRFQGVLKELDIELICAHSPQAKGRVERANQTLQDRLIKALREEAINGVEKGNEYLKVFMKDYNLKFGKAPALAEDAHRSLQIQHRSKYLFMEKEERIIAKDLSFQYKNEIYQIISPIKYRLAKKKIEVYESIEELMVLYQDKELKIQKWKERTHQPTQVMDTKDLEVLWPTRTRTINRKHPWR